MRYFANPSTQPVRDAMTAGLLDCIITPKQGNVVPPGATWCADNGCYGKGYPGDEKWWAWLQRVVADYGADRCAFAVAPDVVGDAEATEARSLPWLPMIRALGVPAAFVAQNGLEDREVLWDAFDVLFIGGDDAFKLGPHARAIAGEAKARGKGVHMGRLNSRKRWQYAATFCDSADGTFIRFGPDVNLPKALAWADQGVMRLEGIA